MEQAPFLRYLGIVWRAKGMLEVTKPLRRDVKRDTHRKFIHDERMLEGNFHHI